MYLEIGSIGYNHKHEKDFFVDRPEGPGAYLFLLVKSNSLFTIKGKHYSVLKNSYVMLHPNTPCFYKGNKDFYTDDWFFFGLDEEGKQFLLDLGLVFDTPVYFEQNEELSLDLHHISFEHFSSSDYHNELKEHYTKIFFYKLARILKNQSGVSPESLATKYERLSYLKTRLYDQPDFFNDVDEMADFVNLSRSGFQHLYKATFGVNVLHDVIQGKVEKAKWFLSNTDFSISEISQKCGYKTDYHFMRQFKEQTGFTPTQFRKSDSWNQIKESR